MTHLIQILVLSMLWTQIYQLVYPSKLIFRKEKMYLILVNYNLLLWDTN